MATARQLLERFNDSKTLPHVALRLSKLISDEGSRVQEFEELIKMDPVLVSRLLRMVNSPYYGVRENITSIARAIVFIGMKNLRNIVVIEGVKGVVGKDSGQGEFSRRRLWLHSIAVSICSQMIVERIFGVRGEDAFLCGILHDIGLIVEDQTAPDLFARTREAFFAESRSLPVLEREIIGTDHCEVGALLVQDWKLPEEVREGIQRHHAFDRATTPNSMAGAIQLSEFFAGKLGYGAFEGATAGLPASLAAHVKGRLQEYRLLARDFPAKMTAAQDLYDHPED
jgi:putative nucleotidyltransferase with HDIG domain